MAQPTEAEVVELVNTSVMVPRKTQQAIRLLAARNERTMGAEIRAALESHVAEPEDEAA